MDQRKKAYEAGDNTERSLRERIWVINIPDMLSFYAARCI